MGQNLSTDKGVMYSKRDRIFRDKNEIKDRYTRKSIVPERQGVPEQKSKFFNSGYLLLLLLLLYCNVTDNL
jgi:hypothetical protein